MTNSWPDDNAEYQASDIDKILDEELKNNKPVLRPTDRKWNKAAQESKPEVKVRPVSTFIARFIAAVIAIAIVSLILLVLFGLFLQVFQWVAGMVR